MRIRNSFRYIHLLLASIFVLTGCATSGTTIVGGAVVSQQEAFSRGNIRLSCVSVGCAFKGGNNQPEMEKLSQQGNWIELATLIMGVGFGNNHGYYYLGRAAEGLDYLEAAKTYYLLSSSALVSANSYGHDLVAEVPERIAKIDNKLKASAKTLPPQRTTENKVELVPLQQETTVNPLIERSDEFNEVIMTKSGGVYMIPASINEVLNIKFIIDSGASDVSISPDIALTLLKTETIGKNDFLPGQSYKLADGSIAQSNRFKLRSLKVGNKVLKNIPCSISNSIDAPLLLGQSALEQLGTFTFDYDAGTVRFKNKLVKPSVSR